MANFVDIVALTRNSAKVATFVVRVHGPQVTEYTYIYKKNQKSVTAKKLEINLIGKSAESYCVRYVKDPGDANGKASHKFSNDSIWQLVETSLRRTHRTRVIGTSVPFRIDFVKSRLDPCGRTDPR